MTGCMQEHSSSWSRRQVLGGAGLFGLATLLGKNGSSQSLWTPPVKPTITPAPFGPAACTLTPATTEGPFYINAALLRQDITEGRPGLPLELNIQVLKLATCAPIPNAVVDIWHCDIGGIYASFPGQLNNQDTQGDNFYRGVQVTDANGAVAFRTIYPGYYPGRCVHIHFKVILNNSTAVTSQFFFQDTFSDEVYAGVDGYLHGNRTLNSQDGIYNSQIVATTTPKKGGASASITFVIN